MDYTVTMVRKGDVDLLLKTGLADKQSLPAPKLPLD